MIQVTEPPDPGGGALGDWLSSVRNTFWSLERELLDLQHRAAVVAARAAQRGETTLHNLARDAVTGIGALRLAYAETRDRFGELIAAVPGLGGIVIPVAYAAAASAIAFAVWGIFRRYNAQERIVALLEAGELTPEEARALLAEAGDPFVSGIGGVGIGVLLAAVALVLYTRGRSG